MKAYIHNIAASGIQNDANLIDTKNISVTQRKYKKRPNTVVM